MRPRWTPSTSGSMRSSTTTVRMPPTLLHESHPYHREWSPLGRGLRRRLGYRLVHVHARGMAGGFPGLREAHALDPGALGHLGDRHGALRHRRSGLYRWPPPGPESLAHGELRHVALRR